MKTELLRTLNKYYILLTPNDLSHYSPNQLHSLVAAKKGQMELQAQTLKIHKELEAMSEANIANHLKKKEAVEDSGLSQLSISKIQPELSFMDHLKSSFLKETRQSQPILPFLGMGKGKVLKGSILNGALAIEVSLEDAETNQIVRAIFLVRTSDTESSVNTQTLDKLNSGQLRRKAPLHSKVELLLEGTESIFTIKEGDNILAADFLLNHSAQLTCDYSEESRQFTLAF